MRSPIRNTAPNHMPSNDTKIGTRASNTDEDEESSSTSDENDQAPSRTQPCTKQRVHVTIATTASSTNSSAAKPVVKKMTNTNDVMIMALVVIAAMYVLKALFFVVVRQQDCRKRSLAEKQSSQLTGATHSIMTKPAVAEKTFTAITDPLPTAFEVDVHSEHSSSTLGSDTQISRSCCGVELVEVGAIGALEAEVSVVNVTNHKDSTVAFANHPATVGLHHDNILLGCATRENRPVPDEHELKTTNVESSVASDIYYGSQGEPDDHESDPHLPSRTTTRNKTSGTSRESLDTAWREKRQTMAASETNEATNVCVVVSNTNHNASTSSMATDQGDGQNVNNATLSVGRAGHHFQQQQLLLESGQDSQTETESEIEPNETGTKRFSLKNKKIIRKENESNNITLGCAEATSAAQSDLSVRTKAMYEEDSNSTTTFSREVNNGRQQVLMPPSLRDVIPKIMDEHKHNNNNNNTYAESNIADAGANTMDTSDGASSKNHSTHEFEDQRETVFAGSGKIQQPPTRPPPMSGPKLHQPTLTAIQSYLNNGSVLEDALDEESLVSFAARMHKNTVIRMRNKVRGTMVVDYEQEALKGTNAEYDYIYNRIYSQEEFLGVASEFYRTVMYHTRNGTDVQANSSSSRIALSWVKNASGMHRQAKIHAEDPEDDFNEEIDMDSSMAAVITSKGEVLATSRRSNRVRVMTTKKKMEKKELKNFRILAEVAKEFEGEQQQQQRDEQQQREVKELKNNVGEESKVIPTKLSPESDASKTYTLKARKNLCVFEGCEKWARRKSFCMRHGGGPKISEFEGCQTLIRGGNDTCQLHFSRGKSRSMSLEYITLDAPNTSKERIGELSTTLKRKDNEVDNSCSTTQENRNQSSSKSVGKESEVSDNNNAIHSSALNSLEKQKSMVVASGVDTVTNGPGLPLAVVESENSSSDINRKAESKAESNCNKNVQCRGIHSRTKILPRPLKKTSSTTLLTQRQEQPKTMHSFSKTATGKDSPIPFKQKEDVVNIIEHKGTMKVSSTQLTETMAQNARKPYASSTVLTTLLLPSAPKQNHSIETIPATGLVLKANADKTTSQAEQNSPSPSKQKENGSHKPLDQRINYETNKSIDIDQSMFASNSNDLPKSQTAPLPSKRKLFVRENEAVLAEAESNRTDKIDASSETKRQKTDVGMFTYSFESSSLLLPLSRKNAAVSQPPQRTATATLTRDPKVVVFHTKRLGLKINADGTHVQVLTLLNREHADKIAVGDYIISVGGRNVERMKKEEIAMVIASTARPTTIQFLSSAK